MYCGNNRNSPKLKGKKIGTRYECFKRGVGVGLSLPLDSSYEKPYIPIDARRIYCGKANKLPPGYDYMGNAPMCLQKGVGVGKVQKAKKAKKKGKKK